VGSTVVVVVATGVAVDSAAAGVEDSVGLATAPAVVVTPGVDDCATTGAVGDDAVDATAATVGVASLLASPW
jgi:hypothetical protein